MAKGYKHLTEDEFGRIKSILSKGVDVGVVSKAVVRSPATVHIIKNSESFEAYRSYVAKRSRLKQERRAKKASVLKNVEVSEVEKVESVEQGITEATGLRIAKAIERLADAWERTPEPKKNKMFFKGQL